MDFLRTFWPTPFRIKQKDVASFVIHLVILIVVCGVVGFLVSLLNNFFIIGIITSIIGLLIEVYGAVGIVLCILRFVGAIK